MTVVLDRALLADVRTRVRRSTDDDPDDLALSRALRASSKVLGSDALRELTLAVRAEVTGAGPLQVLLDLPGVTDVLVNGPGEVWVDRGAGMERAAVELGSPAAVRGLAVRLAAICGQRLDDAAPICDGRLPDGTRLHAVIEPLAASGAVISLRVLRQVNFTLDELVARESLPPAWEPLVRALLTRRANLLISGGTGTGKTTLLAALLASTSPGERIVTVEEARELAPDHPHVVPLVARRANIEGAGGVSLVELVRAALRMRPDRLVVGECRGAEVREMLLAMNTGHDGGMATVHANAAEHVAARLEALAALAGLGREALAAQARAALDVVFHLRRAGARRYVAQIAAVEAGPGVLRIHPMAEWSGSGEAKITDGEGWARLATRFGVSR